MYLGFKLGSEVEFVFVAFYCNFIIYSTKNTHKQQLTFDFTGFIQGPTKKRVRFKVCSSVQ